MSRKPGRKGLSWEDVVELGRGLPDVDLDKSYGTPALKVKKKLLARFHQGGEHVVLRMSIDQRDVVLKNAPEVFEVTPHYQDYDAVLVRLDKVDRALMRELLEEARAFVLPPKRPRTR